MKIITKLATALVITLAILSYGEKESVFGENAEAWLLPGKHAGVKCAVEFYNKHGEIIGRFRPYSGWGYSRSAYWARCKNLDVFPHEDIKSILKDENFIYAYYMLDYNVIIGAGKENECLVLKAVSFKFDVISCMKKIQDQKGKEVINQLRNQLNDSNVRIHAIQLLGKIKDAEAVELLMNTLKNENIQYESLQALKDIGSPAVGPLINALKDESIPQKHNIIRVLGEMKDERAVDTLISFFDVKDSRLQESAIDSLIMIGKPATPSLLTALNDKRDAVKECALRVLNEIRNMDPVAIEPISKLLTNRNRVIRSYAITSLGKIKDARIAEPLLRAYNDLDWRDQVLIVNAFADLGEPAFNGLVIALKSKYSEIRKIAERGLRKIRDDKEVERLVKVAEYERSISQEQPKISKEKIPPNTPPEIKQQIERLYSKDQNEQGNAIYRLGEQKIIAAIPFLVDLLSATQTFQHDDDSYESLGLAAARALGSIGRPALPKLIVALHSDNIFIKTNAAFALGFIEDSESIKALIDSLNSSDDYLRTVIANSLTKTTGKNFGQNQKKWQDWWTKESNR